VPSHGVSSLYSVDNFCYLEWHAECRWWCWCSCRVRKGLNEFRQLVPLLANKDVSLLMRKKLYGSCVSSPVSTGMGVSWQVHTILMCNQPLRPTQPPALNTGQGAVELVCGGEGNRRSDITPATCHSFCGISACGLNGLGKGHKPRRHGWPTLV